MPPKHNILNTWNVEMITILALKITLIPVRKNYTYTSKMEVDKKDFFFNEKLINV